MIQDRRAALQSARRALAPGGEVWVVDFADGAGLWRPFAGLLRGFLRSFHVDPIRADLLAEQGAEVRFGPGRYYLVARLPPC
jgi:S-adenosylmethionine-diacylgycerolhomoserine-N-methlytransferase